MALDVKAFDQVTHADLQQLIDNGVAEDRTYEYKLGPIGNSAEAKKEFLKDLTAFANASGGFVVIGMEEKASVPIKLVGVAVPNIGAEISRLENIIRDGVDPRLVGVQIRAISGPGGDPAIVIRVPRSWNPPHRVKYDGSNRFWLRNSNGAHEMSVQELRSQFLASATLADRVKAIRLERTNVIMQNAGPVSLRTKDCMAIHIVPVASLIDETAVDVERAYALYDEFRPRFPTSLSRDYNFDGIAISADIDKEGTVGAYTQVFRTGVVELVVGHVLYSPRDGDPPQFLRINPVEKRTIEHLPPICGGLAKLQIAAPVFVMLSLINVPGSRIQIDMGASRTLDRQHLHLPAVTFDTLNLQGEWHRAMKVPFDAMWNAYGEPRSPSFATGAWSALKM